MKRSNTSARHRPASRKRVLAGLLVVFAGLAVFIWSVIRNPYPESADLSGSRDLQVISQVPVAQDDGESAGGPLQPELPPHETGRTFYVAEQVAGDGDGSRARPWGDLQYALCRLHPGDRLAITTGVYAAPVSVDGDCNDGAPNRPIEVIAAGEVLLVGPDTREPIDRPALTVARSHWRFRGVQIEPQWTRPGILVATGTVDVKLIDLHVLKGIGDGIRIAHHASEVSIENVHLHHLGTLRGAQRNFRDPDTAGILIAPGTSRIRVTGAEIHHMEGDAIRVVAPERYEAESGLPKASDVTLEGIVSGALFGKWE